jgi:hypothetical protein
MLGILKVSTDFLLENFVEWRINIIYRRNSCFNFKEFVFVSYLAVAHIYV